MKKKSYLYQLLRNIYRDILESLPLFLKIVNLFTPKEKHHLMFIPNENCRVDKYDIINNGSDNVLKLCHSMLNDKRFYDYHLSIVIYHIDNKNTYIEYCKKKQFKGKIDFISYDDKKSLFWSICSSEMIFYANFYHPISYKVSRQIIMCLGYFVLPFKDDYFKIERLGYEQAVKTARKRNKIFDYHLSESDFCSRELSVDSLIYLPKYISLGFPRNDIFYEKTSQLRDKICNAIGLSPRLIVAFVPTHRDYERKTSYLYDPTKSHPHSLFGDITIKDEDSLNEFLEKEDIVIIAKAHPMQEEKIIETSSRRIIYFSDLSDYCQTNLQEILAVSDMLVTDYSTACFDYLLTDRPCIYYFYDYDVQSKSRKFFIDPVTPVCAGEIVCDIKGFIGAIKSIIEGHDNYAIKRKLVRDLIFRHKDGKSTERVKDFVISKTN